MTILLLTSTFLSADTYASEVYECVDVDGQPTFASAPCPREATEVKGNRELQPTIEDQMAKLEIIDRRIARLKRLFHRLPPKPKVNPEAGTNPEQKQIKASYQQQVNELSDQLSKLRSERGRLVQVTMVLINQSNDL